MTGVQTCALPIFKVLSKLDDEIIAIQQGHNIAIAFHPELTDDTRIHEYFIEEVLNCVE